MTKFFGTDGVRGIAGEHLDAILAFRLGYFSSYVISEKNSKKTRIVIGKDTRISGDMLESAFISGALSQGVEVIKLGVGPTPAVAYMTKKCGANVGVVISASHNPMEYNGIKFFNSNGEKLSDELEEEIEEYLLGNKTVENILTGDKIGRLSELSSAPEDYINYVISVAGSCLKDIKIAVDCSNGANSFIAPDAFKQLGATVFTTSVSPDGTNINSGCGSVHIENLSKFTLKVGADVGIAFDGDADRVLAVDENGDVLDGDVLIALIAIEYKNKGLIGNAPVVGTIMSNMGLELTLKEYGIDFVATKVGDRYVYEKMTETGSVIGGEQSGHVISTLYNTTGDGLACALEFLKILKSSGKKASDLRKMVKIMPQVIVNARITGMKSDEILALDDVKDIIEKTHEKYSTCGRLLVRPSGTEPLIRIMLEGPSLDEMTADATEIANLIESKKG